MENSYFDVQTKLKLEKKEIMNEMEKYNQILVSIVNTLQLHKNADDTTKQLVDLLQSNIQKYDDTIALLTNQLIINEQIFLENKKIVVDEFNKIQNIATEKKWILKERYNYWNNSGPSPIDICHSYYVIANTSHRNVIVDDPLLIPFINAQKSFFEIENTYNSNKLHIPYYHHILKNYKDFLDYSNEIIQDFTNVIILVNTDIISTLKILDPESIRELSSEYLYVIDEDTDFYYGITELGFEKNLFKITTDVTIDTKKSPYFIISDLDKFIHKIFEIKTDTRKKLLFENLYSIISNPRNFDCDDDWECRAPRSPIPETDVIIEMPNYKLAEGLISNYSYKYNYTLVTQIWIFFVKEIQNGNSYNRKNILQQFKYLFTKDSNEEKILYLKLENYINPKTTLFELFLPEIKFLLHRIYIPDRLQTEWDEYVAEHNKSVTTKPETFLHYLLNVVLSNLVSRELYKSLLITISEMTRALTIDMSTKDRRTNYKLISDIIDRVIQKYKLKQEGGIQPYKKKNVSRTKKGSKLLNNKITSRQNKISRKK